MCRNFSDRIYFLANIFDGFTIIDRNEMVIVFRFEMAVKFFILYSLKPTIMEQDYDRSFSIFFSPAVIICWLAITIFLIAAQWKIFTKAGQPGWACIIPIYNIYIMLKIVGKPWWWLLLMLIPFVNLIYAIWMINMLSKSFGKDEGFTVGLLLLAIIFYPILGFGPAKYLGPYGDPVAFRAYQEQHKFDFENKQ